MKAKLNDGLKSFIRGTVAEVLLDLITDPVQSPVREEDVRERLIQSLRRIKQESQYLSQASQKEEQHKRSLSRWTP